MKFIVLLVTIHVTLIYRIITDSFIVKCDDKSLEEQNIVKYEVDSIPLTFIPGTGYVVDVEIGGQQLKLLLTSNICGLMLFENTERMCFKKVGENCYEPSKSKSARWCDTTQLCIPGRYNFECNEVNSPEGIRDLTVSQFRINSTNFQITSIEGYESFKLVVDHKRTNYEFPKIPVKLARGLDRYDINVFANVDGLMGISGFEMCCRSSVWEKISRDYRGFFVLDINPPTSKRFPSKLYLGTDRIDDEDIVWSERRQSGGLFTDSYLQFTMHDLTMCGVSLFGKTSSNWEATIDLSVPYLVLPKNFWITLMTYLPIDKSCFTDNKKPRLCKMVNVERHFPLLEFKLNHSYHLNFEKVEAHTLSIPLENLLEEEGNTKTILIVPDEGKDKSPYTLNPSIKLGYKVLESLLVAVDSDGLRIGLANKNQLIGSHSKCAAIPNCFGDQIYEPALNICVDPICSIWLMKRLNPETRVCETSVIAKVVFTTVVSALIVAEFYCNFARKHILRIASRLCQ